MPKQGSMGSAGRSCSWATTCCQAVSGVVGPVLNLCAEAGRAGGRSENSRRDAWFPRLVAVQLFLEMLFPPSIV